MDAPKWGDDVIVMHDNVEGRYYITSVAGRSKTSKTGGNEPSTTDVTTASNAFDPCDPKKKKEAKKETPTTAKKETPPTAKNKPTTNGTKVKASVQCLDRKGMTHEEYYQAELKIFRTALEAAATKAHDDPLSALDDANIKYDKNEKAARRRRSLPDCAPISGIAKTHGPAGGSGANNPNL